MINFLIEATKKWEFQAANSKNVASNCLEQCLGWRVEERNVFKVRINLNSEKKMRNFWEYNCPGFFDILKSKKLCKIKGKFMSFEIWGFGAGYWEKMIKYPELFEILRQARIKKGFVNPQNQLNWKNLIDLNSYN